MHSSPASSRVSLPSGKNAQLVKRLPINFNDVENSCFNRTLMCSEGWHSHVWVSSAIQGFRLYFKVGCKWNIKQKYRKKKWNKTWSLASIATAVIIRYPMKKKEQVEVWNARCSVYRYIYIYRVIIEFNGDMVPIMKAIKKPTRNNNMAVLYKCILVGRSFSKTIGLSF